MIVSVLVEVQVYWRNQTFIGHMDKNKCNLDKYYGGRHTEEIIGHNAATSPEHNTYPQI